MRSVLATFIFAIAFNLLLALKFGLVAVTLLPLGLWEQSHLYTLLFFLLIFLTVGAAPDYLALAKTRLLLRLTSSEGSALWLTPFLVVADIICSLLITLVVGFALYVFVFKGVFEVFLLSGILWLPFAGSTIFTSVWIFFILLSATFLKLLAPLQRFTTYFFDVDKHPVKSIGIVAGALIMVISGLGRLLALLI